MAGIHINTSKMPQKFTLNPQLFYDVLFFFLMLHITKKKLPAYLLTE